jgi:hypothetical protein
VAASDGTYTDRVEVTWSASSGATYYEVYRAGSESGAKSLLGSPAASPFDDSSAAVGTTYYYWVKACNSWGCSDFSTYNTGYRSGTPPPVPANVQASDGDYTDKVRVTWNSSSGASDYEVYRATSATGTKSLLSNPSVTSFDDTSAAVGTTYYYWVKACNSWGCSDFSTHDTGYSGDLFRIFLPIVMLGQSVGGQTDWVYQEYTFQTLEDASYVRLRGVVGGTIGAARGSIGLDEVGLTPE